MKVSTRCRYGLRALLEIAKQGPASPVTRQTISENQGISKAYLENILSVLRAKNLIRTERGASGGFLLQSEPRQITVLQIVNALEGSIAPVNCVDEPGSCEKTGHCAARNVWQKLYDAQVNVLSGITLQDILDDESGNDSSSYSI
jgi:Rrf2 family transcriptional regulator, cysteine metabolism repressor